MVAIMILGLATVTAREIIVAGQPQRAARPPAGPASDEPDVEDTDPVHAQRRGRAEEREREKREADRHDPLLNRADAPGSRRQRLAPPPRR